MSLLQETHSQYATFADTASCGGDLHASGTVFAPAITVDAIAAVPSLDATTVDSDAIATAALQVTTTPAAGYVLTGDATGNASWQQVPPSPAASAAYGYSIGEGANSIGSSNYITFDQGTAVSNSGFVSVPGAPTGSSYIIETAGVYEYNFYVIGANGAATTKPLEVAIISTSVNLNVATPPNTFRSGLGRADVDSMVCKGSGFITLTALDLVSLQNVSNVAINLLPAGGTAAVNRAWVLKRVA